DGRADVYSLAIVLWELFTGRRPFEKQEVEGSWIGTLSEFTTERLSGVGRVAQRQLASCAPSGLCQVLMRCLAADREERFADAGQLARQLQLQRFPRLQRLLNPGPHSWQRWVAGWPLLFISIAVLLPNIALSALNLFYNIPQIVNRCPPLQQEIFYKSLTPVNGIIYGLATAICIWYLWPVVSALSRLRSVGSVTPDQRARLQQRALRVATLVSWVVFIAWITSGFVFSLLMNLGDPEEASKELYLHFLPSQFLHGIIVASLSFMFVTFMMVRAVYPLFLADESDRMRVTSALDHARRFTNLYAAALGFAPLLAIVALAVLGSDKAYFIVLAILGAFGFLIALLLKPIIHTDLDEIELAVRPHDQLLAMS
ncbi:MAG: hypothetical protein N2C12_06730, partial [Planctomycetales bacterium]